MPKKPKGIRTTREQARSQAADSGVVAPVFSEYVNDPIGFAKKIGLRLWKRQRDILHGIVANKKVAVCSGQKVSKSNTFVVAALWWTATRGRGRVLFTAPANSQVRDILWKELRRICNSVTPDGRTVSEILGVEPAILPSTGMQWPDGREIIGFSADTPERMQGFSGPNTLALLDESSGIADEIFEAIQGNAAGGGHIAAAGNPTQQSGWFFDAFHTKREFWFRLEISSEETPNCTGEEPPIPGLADPDFIKSMEREHGRESAFFKVRILGKFAGTASNAIIGLALIDPAKLLWKNRVSEPTESLELGVDVARFGDDESTIAPRRGNRAYEIESVHGFDTVAVAGKVNEVIDKHRRPGERVSIKIDTSGGYGAGVADLLRSQNREGISVFDVNSSEKSDDPEKYVNVRSQLHFAVRDWLKDGGELPEDPKLEAELLTPTYSYDARNRMKVESKDEIKKRLKRSPDRSDALALSIYRRTTGRAKSVSGSGSRWGEERGYG